MTILYYDDWTMTALEPSDMHMTDVNTWDIYVEEDQEVFITLDMVPTRFGCN